MDPAAVAAELRQAFFDYQEGEVAQRVGTRLGDLSAMVLVPGVAAGLPVYTVKVHAKNPRRRPALSGVICLHDLGSGDLLAVLDSAWLTALRTGLGAALGTDILACPDARRVGVIGAGVQGRAQLSALAALRRVESVVAFDPDPETLAGFCDEVEATLAVPVWAVSSSAGVAAEADIILTATWASAPVLTSGEVRPGTHVTSLGSDEPGKHELDPGLLSEATVVVDDGRLAAAVIGPVIDATLSEVLRGDHPGRGAATDVTVYTPVGLPMQDCVIAWHAYRRAVDLGLGSDIDFQT